MNFLIPSTFEQFCDYLKNEEDKNTEDDNNSEFPKLKVLKIDQLNSEKPWDILDYENTINLLALDISGVEITSLDVEIFTNLFNLRFLNLSHNLLHSLEGVEFCHNLVELDVSHNLLPNISHFHVLDCEVNPFLLLSSSFSFIQHQISHLLPTILYLNNHPMKRSLTSSSFSSPSSSSSRNNNIKRQSNIKMRKESRGGCCLILMDSYSSFSSILQSKDITEEEEEGTSLTKIMRSIPILLHLISSTSTSLSQSSPILPIHKTNHHIDDHSRFCLTCSPPPPSSSSQLQHNLISPYSTITKPSFPHKQHSKKQENEMVGCENNYHQPPPYSSSSFQSPTSSSSSSVLLGSNLPLNENEESISTHPQVDCQSSFKSITTQNQSHPTNHHQHMKRNVEWTPPWRREPTIPVTPLNSSKKN